MFVRFPIILARPTSLRGSLSPDLWQKVIGRTPGGVFPWTVSPRRWKTKLWALLFLLCFWCDKPWKNTQRGRLGFVLCVCVCPDVSPVCFPPRHADTGTGRVPGGSGTTKPGSLRVLPSGQPAPSHPARPPHLHVAGDDTVLHPPSVLPSCLQPPVSVLVPPRVVQVNQPALPEVYFSMWPIASMFRWAGHSVW